MEGMVKVAAGAVIAAMLGIILQKQGKEFTLALVVAVSAMGACLALAYLQPVISFLEELRNLGNLDSEIIKILLKAVAVGLIGEISGAVCTDSGNASISKILQLVTTSVILWLSLPILQQVMGLIGEILEGI